MAQFRNEFDRRRRETVRTVEAIAASDAVRKIAMQPDTAEYYDYAAPLAATHDLDLLELVSGDGTIVSSAEWPARFGYKEEWLTTGEDWNQRGAFLRREELEQRVTLSLVAVAAAAKAIASCTWWAGRNWTATSSPRWCCRRACACCCTGIWMRSSRRRS